MNLPLFVKRLIYGGTGHLAPREKMVLQSVVRHLPKDEAEVVEEQCREVETVQRQVGGRIVMLSFSSARPPRQIPGDQEYCLARVRFEADGKKGSASVWVVRGQLRTVEYARPPKDDLSILSVEIRPQKAHSVAAAIDRLEHPHEDRG